MTKFNLKNAQYKNVDNLLKDKNKETDLESAEPKNINLQMPIKDKDNTEPFESQLESERVGDTLTIAEKNLNDAKKLFNDKRLDEWDTDVMPINLATEAYDQKKNKDIKNAEENEKKDTEFWDKYIGTQMIGEKTTISKNVEKDQLQNNPDRFKNLSSGNPVEKAIDANVDKMVTASLTEADATLFHIYAQAEKEDRELNDKEKQIVLNVNNYKSHLLSQQFEEVVIKTGTDGKSVVYENGQAIDNFDSTQEAKMNYPEASIL